MAHDPALLYEIFDGLLIGNFMKTILRGKQGPGRLYPDRTPFLATYVDNGQAKRKGGLWMYFAEYCKRAALGFPRYRSAKRAEAMYPYVTEESIAHQPAMGVYWKYKKTWRWPELHGYDVSANT